MSKDLFIRKRHACRRKMKVNTPNFQSCFRRTKLFSSPRANSAKWPSRKKACYLRNIGVNLEIYSLFYTRLGRSEKCVRMMSTRAPGRAKKVKEQSVWFGQPCKRGWRVHVRTWEVKIVIQGWKVRRMCIQWVGGRLSLKSQKDQLLSHLNSNENEIRWTGWRLKHTHSASCTLMKYHSDQAIG